MRVWVWLALAALPALGQQSARFAAVSGQVEDESGGWIRAAVVAITNLEQNDTRKVVTGDGGRFRFAYLPAGEYALEAVAPNFARRELRFTAHVGEALDLNIVLPLAKASETVEISARVPVVEAARTQVSELVRRREIDELPLNGRNYLDLALLASGVSRSNLGAQQQFAETSAVPGTGLSISGQRNLNNSFVVDGLSANDDAAGLAGTFFSQEVVREFQVVTSGGIAEFGRASAGVINIVTQSGTNTWHGRGYGFLRNQRLDARHPLATRKDPLTQAQYGATAGGPLRRDRAFVFSNFEQTRRQAAGFVTVAPEAVSAVRAVYPAAPVGTGEFSTGLDTTNWFARADYRTGAQQWTARYGLYAVKSGNARTAGGLNAVSRGSALDDLDQAIAVHQVAGLSASAVNELRLQFARSSLRAPVNDPAGPAVNISGVANFGTATFSPTGRFADQWEASENLSTVRGQHTLKAGVDYLENRVNIIFPGALQPVYNFASLAAFAAGRYITFQQAFGEPAQFIANSNPGAFVQDEWRARPDFTVNAGLRFDLQRLPAPIRTDWRKAAPRLGIAFSPGDHKTVVRASAGLYYDRIPLRAVSNALQRDGVRYRTAVLPFGMAGAPEFPDALAGFPGGLATSITTMDPRIRNGYAAQTGFELEREVAGGAVAVGYTHLRGVHLMLSRNLNVPGAAGRPDPRFANISQYEASGDSYYNGMTVSYRARLGSRAGLRLSYTLSKAIDDTGNYFFSTPQDNFNLRDDRGLSDNDQRHRLAVSGWWEAPHDWELGYIFSYASAFPYNIQTGTDRNGDTNVNDRPVGVGRNTGVGFDAAALNLRVSRTFRRDRWRLQLLAEGLNVLNRVNRQLPNNVAGPSLGRATAAGDPRQVQVGLRVSY